MNLLGAILAAFGYEPRFVKRPGPGLWDTIAVGRDDRARAAAPAAPLEVEVKRLQDGFGRDRALAPLERAQGFVCALGGDAPWRIVSLSACAAWAAAFTSEALQRMAA